MKIVDQAQRVLNLMAERSKDGVFEGNMTALILEAEGTFSNYSRILRTLQESGAIEQIQRGGGPLPSRWKILDPKAELKPPGEQRITQKRYRTLEDEVEVLKRQVGGIDIPKALATMQGEITKLRGMVEGAKS